MYGTNLTFIEFNNFGTRCLFHSFYCTTQRIFEPVRVHEPGFNIDKYGMWVQLTNKVNFYMRFF